MPYRFKKHYTLAEARAMLPKVSEWLDDLARLARGRRGGAGRTRPLVGELVLSLVQDAPNSVRALSDADCDRLALGDAALWDVARANLGRLPISVEGAGRVRQVVAGGTYDATCLVHPRLLEHLPVGTLAAAPCRSVLLLGAEDRRQVRAELDALARPLSPDLVPALDLAFGVRAPEDG